MRTRGGLRRWLPFCGLACLIAAAAQAQTPLGPELRLNIQQGSELEPDLTSGADGVFTAVWIHAPDPTQGPQDINARRFTKSGLNPRELTLVRASAPEHAVDAPAITPDPVGGWSLFYTQDDPLGYRKVLEAQFFRNGSPNGPRRLVSEPAPSLADLRAAASLPGGRSIFISEDDLCIGCRNLRHHLFARVLGRQGEALTPYFLVDSIDGMTDRASSTGAKSLGVDSAGNIVVVWETQPDVVFPKQTAILGLRFSSAGERSGSPFPINEPSPGVQFLPSVSVNPGGDFIVVWQYQPDPDTPRSLRARHFSKTGKPMGREFVVEADSVREAIVPSIASDPRGNYVVVWTSYAFVECPSVMGRLYRPDDTPAGPAFSLSSSPHACDQFPKVAFGADGTFAAAWIRLGGGDFTSDIYAAMFRITP